MTTANLTCPCGALSTLKCLSYDTVNDLKGRSKKASHQSNTKDGVKLWFGSPYRTLSHNDIVLDFRRTQSYMDFVGSRDAWCLKDVRNTVCEQ